MPPMALVALAVRNSEKKLGTTQFQVGVPFWGSILQGNPTLWGSNFGAPYFRKPPHGAPAAPPSKCPMFVLAEPIMSLPR